MRRYGHVFLWILSGALATGIGMLVILKQANTDRRRLTQLVSKTQKEFAIAEKAKQALIEMANKKLDVANKEMSRAQAIITALKEERDLSTTAQALNPPTPRMLKGWKEVVNLPLGVSCRFPPNTRAETNDANSLMLAVERPDNSPASVPADLRIFSLTTYDERQEKELLSSFTTSTPVSYRVRGRLLLGHRGRVSTSPHTMIVLRMRANGETKHLIWARTLDGVSEQTILTLLATMDVQI